MRKSTWFAGIAARPLSHTTSNVLLKSLQNLSSPAPCVPAVCSTMGQPPRAPREVAAAEPPSVLPSLNYLISPILSSVHVR